MSKWACPVQCMPVRLAAGLMLLGIALTGPAGRAATPLPQGLGDARWGMTVEELRRHVPVQKVDLADPFSYAEHLEEEPDVYVGATDGKRVEYYFYEGALYKLFIIHASDQREALLYHQLTQRLTAAHGPPHRAYDEVVFGLRITHTVWEDPATSLDLRFGGGFVFEVHTDRARASAKQDALKRKKFI